MTLPTEVVSYSATQQRILEMLGNGLAPAVCASALGVSESYISQLLADPEFARQVTERRYTNLQAATVRDRTYDSIEDELIEKMKDMLPLMYKPMEVLRAITVINQAKRRGADAPSNTVINQTIVQLTLPGVISNKFVKDINNQVIEAGEQQLVTIGSKNLTSQLEQYKTKAGTLSQPLGIQNDKLTESDSNRTAAG